MNITEKDLETLNYLGLEKPEKKDNQMRGGVRPNSGNKGYGKTEMIKQNFDKFSPLFWQLMEEMANSTSKDDKKFFITEFNKIQTKMLPQQISGEDGEQIVIKVVNFGDSNPPQLQAETIPTGATESPSEIQDSSIPS